MRKCLVSTSIRAPRTVPRRGTSSLKTARFSDSTVPAFRSPFLNSNLHYRQLPAGVPVVPISAIWGTGPYVQIAKRHERIVNTERQLKFTNVRSAANCSAKFSLRTSTIGQCNGFRKVQRIETPLYRNTQGISNQRCILHNRTNAQHRLWHGNYTSFQVWRSPGIRFAFVVTHPLEHDNRNDVT